ncbi:MAG: sialidase family protein [Woeseiaceae bacterium]|nr:sialidase family protein [Woeseiaceae bacterium]MDX2608838.1 sialidase family protein [Woeseiaceae bacterium]
MPYPIIRAVLILLASLALFACGGGSSSSMPPVVVPPPQGPITFHCSKDATCPEVTIIGDPHSDLNGMPDPFRGYGDPSLEHDSATGTLWLAYSWLNTQVSDPGPPVVFDLGVRTRLARSNDNGGSFTFVRTVNDMQMEAHPETGVMGWSVHEVSTLVKEPSGSWQILWLKYFNPFGTVTGVDERQEFLYWRTSAATPDLLGDNSAVWGKFAATSVSWGAPFDFNTIPELADCILQTEPALFAFNGETYLATSCLVVDGTGRRTDLERIELLRQTANGYDYVGTILDGQDAADLGVDTIEQADISVARDGSILLVTTPIILGADPDHQGCMVFSFADFASATITRDTNGVAIPRAIITADGNSLGPGLCTYDANSDTGVLLIITTVTGSGSTTDIEFSLHATGVHP